MRFSFDIDGTYLAYPEQFDALAMLLQSSEHEVGILSNRSEEQALTEDELGFEPDFEIYLGNSDDEMSVQERCVSKYEAMVSGGIDIHYDDEAEYFPDIEPKIVIPIS